MTNLLLFSYRHQDIIARKSRLNLKLDQLMRQLMDLQSYASRIADGNVTMDDMINCPATMFNRMSIFTMTAGQSAVMNTEQKFAIMSQMNPTFLQGVDPSYQAAYVQMMKKQLYDQEMQKASDGEAKRLNVEETKINQEKARVETQLKMLDAEEEQVTKGEDDSAKKAAPQFVP